MTSLVSDTAGHVLSRILSRKRSQNITFKWAIKSMTWALSMVLPFRQAGGWQGSILKKYGHGSRFGGLAVRRGQGLVMWGAVGVVYEERSQ
jgi:hypothetical protein